jgi:hypothetical protein
MRTCRRAITGHPTPGALCAPLKT